jgi:membrane protease YdiL (CAAX protease family)
LPGWHHIQFQEALDGLDSGNEHHVRGHDALAAVRRLGRPDLVSSRDWLRICALASLAGDIADSDCLAWLESPLELFTWKAGHSTIFLVPALIVIVIAEEALWREW